MCQCAYGNHVIYLMKCTMCIGCLTRSFMSQATQHMSLNLCAHISEPGHDQLQGPQILVGILFSKTIIILSK